MKKAILIMFLLFVIHVSAGPKHSATWYGQHAGKYFKISYTLSVNLALQDVITVECYNPLNINFKSVSFYIVYSNNGGYKIGEEYVTPDYSWINHNSMKRIIMRRFSPLGCRTISVTVDSASPY